MTIRVELNPETEASPSPRHARRVYQWKSSRTTPREALTGRSLSRGQVSVEEFHRMLDAMAEGSERLPDLPTESFSRESFYGDRLDGRDAVPGR
jgi:hypothetical protein